MPRATAALAHARACATPSRLCLYIYIENMVLQKGAVGVSNRVTVNVYANMSSNLFLLVLHSTLSRWVRLPSLGIADVLTLNIF